MEPSVRVQGIPQLRSALRKIDAELPREMNQEFGKLAAKIAEKIAGKVPRLSGKAAGSVKGRSGGKIAFGGSAAPYFPWLDFGGSTGRGHKPGASGSGSIKRATPPDGRYVYPTLKEERGTIHDDVDRLISRLASQAGFEQSGSN